MKHLMKRARCLVTGHDNSLRQFRRGEVESIDETEHGLEVRWRITEADLLCRRCGKRSPDDGALITLPFGRA